MIDTILLLIQTGCLGGMLLCLMNIKRRLRGIDSGQEETNEYLSDIRKVLKGNIKTGGDKEC